METPGYGCLFPKDENKETEVSQGFRFFVHKFVDHKLVYFVFFKGIMGSLILRSDRIYP